MDLLDEKGRTSESPFNSNCRFGVIIAGIGLDRDSRMIHDVYR